MLFTNNTTRTASVSARERDTHKQTHAQRSREREREMSTGAARTIGVQAVLGQKLKKRLL